MDLKHRETKEKEPLVSSGKAERSAMSRFLFEGRFFCLCILLGSSDEGDSSSELNKSKSKDSSGFQKISGKAWGVLVSTTSSLYTDVNNTCG